MSFKGNAQHGLTYLVSYTWSKSLDLGRTGWYGVEGCSIQTPYNIQADKELAATDPHIFSAAWVYTLPFGRGQKLSSGNKVVDTLIGSWNRNSIVSFSSGALFDVGTGKGPRRHWQLGLSALGIMNSLSCSAQTPRCRLHFHWDSLIPSGRIV